MPRAIWRGSISFGLVNIPVKLYSAVVDRSVRFHRLHASDGVRLRQKMYCPADGEDVDLEDAARGYEVSRDHYVIVTDEEIEGMAPEATRSIQVTDFVDLARIDPIAYVHPYYLVPAEGASEPYNLLAKAMTDAGKAAIARLVMHNKAYLAALRTIDGIICLETMRFADEILKPSEIEEGPEKTKVDAKQLEMANRLIDMLAADFELEKYHDDYREQLQAMVDKKAKGEQIVAAEAPPPPAKVIDLTAALEQSLAKARERKKEKAG
ncbi:MAG: Ku protein [Actinomycetota bacterium]